VLPYDSATGSSGPAHQACEYGVPIVSADLPDFRGMATDEDMAIHFYERGNADDLADQISTILLSPELEREMAMHNYAAGVEMTITNVVNNYLRWFRLNKAKRDIRTSSQLPTQAVPGTGLEDEPDSAAQRPFHPTLVPHKEELGPVIRRERAHTYAEGSE
jgi:alkyl sulfatase BDS1-like metallo-beta-lactamase superfamily hydrolase